MTALASFTTERKATMASTGKGFRILSSTLYKDKLLAMVREIVHNALDAHREVGRADQPFTIHVPTPREPWFAVRDFGPSIPDDLIADVYLTYLQSTKVRHSGNLAGQLGLGSKAPLAVAESFNVATFIDGVKRVYTVFFDENDEVTVSPAVTTTTEEPNGLEVRVEIPSSDFSRVESKIAEVLTYFDVIPNFTGKQISVQRPQPMLSGDNFVVRYVAQHHYANRTARAVMGGIIYPIELDLLSDLTAPEKAILDLPLDIIFPLGALDFTPSRESLSYDKRRTLPTIKATAKRLISDLRAQLDADFAKCPTELAARRKFATILKDTALSQVLRATGGRVAWRGLTIASSAFQRNLKDFPGVTVTGYYPASRGVKTTVHDVSVEIPCHDGITLIDNNRGKPSANHAQTYARNHSGGSRYNRSEVVKFFYVTGPDVARAAFIASLPHLADDVTPVTDLIFDAGPREKTNAKRVYANGNYRQDWRHTGRLDRKNLTSGWNIDPRDENMTGFYVVLTRHEVVDPRFNQQQWEALFDAALKTGLFSETDWVMAIPSSSAAQFKKSKNWKEFYPEMQRRGHALLAKKNPWLAKARYEAVEALDLSHEWTRYLDVLSPVLAPEQPIRRFYETVEAWVTDYRDARDRVSLGEVLGVDQEAPVLDRDLAGEWAAIHARYPLLKALCSHEDNVRGRYRRDDRAPEDEVDTLALPYFALVDGAK